MKYIDAERLMAEIRKLREEKPFCDDSSLLAYLHGLSKIEDFIDSLQQEQPEVNEDEPHWKPSEEQMKALKRCVDGWTDDGNGALDSLYNDLQKLM